MTETVEQKKKEGIPYSAAVALAFLGLLGYLAWNFSPEPPVQTSSPPPPPTIDPPTKLQRVELRIISMDQIEKPVFDLNGRGGMSFSIHSLFENIGLELDILDQYATLDYAPKISLQEIEKELSGCKSSPPKDNNSWLACAYWVSSPSLTDFGGKSVVGTVIRSAKQEPLKRVGFAVYRSEIRSDGEGMLTMAHELMHLLNIHHADAEAGRATVEGLDRLENTTWKLSEQSRDHLKSHGEIEYALGGGLPFGAVTDRHCDNHNQIDGALSYRMFRNGQVLDDVICFKGSPTPLTEAIGRQQGEHDSVFPEIEFALSTEEKIEINTPFELGLRIVNTSSSSIYIPDPPSPNTGDLYITVEGQGALSKNSRVFIPAQFARVTSPQMKKVPPGQVAEWSIGLLSDIESSLFENAGNYKLTAAVINARDSSGRSAPLTATNEISVFRVSSSPPARDQPVLARCGYYGENLSEVCTSYDESIGRITAENLPRPSPMIVRPVLAVDGGTKDDDRDKVSQDRIIAARFGVDQCSALEPFQTSSLPGLKKLVIEGHTDSQGSCEYNAQLGQARANYVAQLLVSDGFSADSLRVVSCGRDSPSQADVHSFEDNRRVEIVALDSFSEYEICALSCAPPANIRISKECAENLQD